MKIKLYGTAAAEGVPALFCNCRVCLNAQKVGGKEIRTRTQALIDETVLIDFPADTYAHKIYDGLPLSDLEHLVVTHSHHDHFFAEDIMMRMTGYANMIDNQLTVYGNDKVKSMYERAQDLEGFSDETRVIYKEVFEYQSFMVEDYTFTPLLANHAKNEKCYIYEIKKDDKTMLYGNDSGKFLDTIWKHWEETKPFFDLVILDCTHQEVKVESNHMSFYDNLDTRAKMLAMNLVDENTRFVITHFSHNGGLSHAETEAWAKENGFIVAYDGIEFEV